MSLLQDFAMGSCCGSLPQEATMELYHGRLLWEFTVGGYRGSLLWEFTVRVYHGGYCRSLLQEGLDWIRSIVIGCGGNILYYH